MEANMIEIKNLQKSFSSQKVINNINLKIKKGEILGILGANGAGKTTTLKILTGLLKADQGLIKIMGENTTKKLPARIKRKLGVVFEESNLYKRLNALDNLELFAGINNVSKKKIEKLLFEYELQTAAKKEVRYFSKGMKKRLMICRALLSEPEILILDEATGGLDPISAEIIRNKVLELKKAGKTVILSTHYLEEADRLCDRIAFIKQGKLIAVDAPAVFKDKFNKKSLELRFLVNQQLSQEELKITLNSLGISKKDYTLNKQILSLNLPIENATLKKAAKIAEKFEFIEIDKIEADLQDIFKELSS